MSPKKLKIEGLIMKIHAADPEIGSLTKSISRPYGP